MNIRLSSARKSAVIAASTHIHGPFRVAYVGGQRIEFIVLDDKGCFCITDVMTPAVQSFLSRLAKENSLGEQEKGNDGKSPHGCEAQPAHERAQDGHLAHATNGKSDGDAARANVPAPGSPQDDGEQSSVLGVPDAARRKGLALSRPGREQAIGQAELDKFQSEEIRVQLADDVSATSENKSANPFREMARASRSARKAHGGVLASLRGKSLPAIKDVKRAKRLFRKLIRGGESEPGPRWDSAAVAIRTAGYLREWRVSDRREEEGRPSILVLPDVSGSVGVFVNDILSVSLAVQIAYDGPACVVVSHSNAFPVEISDRKGVLRTVPPVTDRTDYYAQLIARYDVRAIVIVADADGVDTYAELAERFPDVLMVWADCYGARQIGHFRVRDAAYVHDDKRLSRVRYADGCNSVADFLDAIEQLSY